MDLTQVLARPDVWRGNTPSAAPRGIPTGFSALDQRLPGGGWPEGALTEVLAEREGVGELSLFLPALARLAGAGRWIVWVAPPHVPYAPALAAAGVDPAHVLLVHPASPADAAWAVAQALGSGTPGAVLAWLPAVEERELRRLQLAAEAGHTWGVVFRPAITLHHPSPAAVRLTVTPAGEGSAVRMIKVRGGQPFSAVLPLG